MHVFNDIYDGLQEDEAILWVKPLDIVKVSYGRHDNSTLRGDACYGSWNWFRPTDSWLEGGEGYLMSANQEKGLMVEVTPMEGFYVQAFAPITTQEKAADTYKKLRAGFAYTVPGLVKVKGQYIGKGQSDDESTTAVNEANSNCTLEAEVDVLAVEGLNVGVGFQYNVVKDGAKAAAAAVLEHAEDNGRDFLTMNEEDYEAGISRQMKIALGASYQVMPELKVSASGAFYTFYKQDYIITDVKVDPRFEAGVGIDYDLGDGLAANADFRYLSPVKVDGEKADNSDHMAFSVGVQKNVSSNGYIGVAFQGQTNGGTFAGNVIEGAEADKFTWAIPVALSVWF